MNEVNVDEQNNNKQIIIDQDGTLCYHIKGIIGTNEVERNILMNRILNETDFHKDVIQMRDKTYVVAREVAYYSDVRSVYDYSGLSHGGLPWTSAVKEIKDLVEKLTGYTYNFCVINKYPDGKSTIGFHYDKLGDHVKGHPIASVSLGATRDFQIRARKNHEHIYGKRILYTIPLDAGDLLVMSGTMQDRFMHCVPKRTKVKDMRINLTFRRLSE